MKRRRKPDDEQFPSQRHCGNNNSVAATVAMTILPSHVEVGTFTVGERSFPKRRRVPVGMNTQVPVWAARVRAKNSRNAVTTYFAFIPKDVQVMYS